MNNNFKVNEFLLVVEDDSELREAICEALDSTGCPVHAVPTAEDALAFVRNNSCFAIVSDFRMSGMNGIQLCKQVKEELPRIKFVILTGYADKQTVLDGFITDCP